MPEQLYRGANFLTSAAKISQLPRDYGVEVAFVGRSNAGKSSALNTITQQKSLAHTSKTPGRTQLINLFTLDETRRLVDLPGYGYAKVPDEVKQRWQATLAEYLETRQSLRGLVLVMDVRHPLRDLDLSLLEWTIAANIPVHAILTKADKLKRGAASNTLLEVRQYFRSLPGSCTCQLFSSADKTGLREIYNKLDSWFFNSK